jgi:hypothetical protein
VLVHRQVLVDGRCCCEKTLQLMKVFIASRYLVPGCSGCRAGVIVSQVCDLNVVSFPFFHRFRLCWSNHTALHKYRDFGRQHSNGNRSMIGSTPLSPRAGKAQTKACPKTLPSAICEYKAEKERDARLVFVAVWCCSGRFVVLARPISRPSCQDGWTGQTRLQTQD